MIVDLDSPTDMCPSFGISFNPAFEPSKMAEQEDLP